MSYFKPEDLKKFGEITDLQPEMGRKFFAWYNEVFKEGALTIREKNLIDASSPFYFRNKLWDCTSNQWS